MSESEKRSIDTGCVAGFRRWMSRSRGPVAACVCGLFFWLGQFAGAVQKGERIIRADEPRR